MSQLDDVMARRKQIRERAARGRAMRSLIASMHQSTVVFAERLVPAFTEVAESMRRFAEARDRPYPRTREPG